MTHGADTALTTHDGLAVTASWQASPRDRVLGTKARGLLRLPRPWVPPWVFGVDTCSGSTVDA